ncbi:unnamed protein product [Gadus morhua 'NCC']
MFNPHHKSPESTNGPSWVLTSIRVPTGPPAPPEERALRSERSGTFTDCLGDDEVTLWGGGGGHTVMAPLSPRGHTVGGGGGSHCDGSTVSQRSHCDGSTVSREVTLWGGGGSHCDGSTVSQRSHCGGEGGHIVMAPLSPRGHTVGGGVTLGGGHTVSQRSPVGGGGHTVMAPLSPREVTLWGGGGSHCDGSTVSQRSHCGGGGGHIVMAPLSPRGHTVGGVTLGGGHTVMAPLSPRGHTVGGGGSHCDGSTVSQRSHCGGRGGHTVMAPLSPRGHTVGGGGHTVGAPLSPRGHTVGGGGGHTVMAPLSPREVTLWGGVTLGGGHTVMAPLSPRGHTVGGGGSHCDGSTVSQRSHCGGGGHTVGGGGVTGRRQERADSPGPSCVSMKSEHYMGELRRIRSEFVKGVSDPVIKGLLDDLYHHEVFSSEEKDSVMEEQRSRADQARCLIDMVIRKGEGASQMMIDGIKERDKHLCINLGLISSLAGSPSTHGAESPSTHGAESPSTHGAESPSTHGAESPSTHGAESPSTNAAQSSSTKRQQQQGGCHAAMYKHPKDPDVGLGEMDQN